MTPPTGPHAGRDDLPFELELAQARLASLRDFHPDGVFSVDLEGRFTAVNAEALVQSGGYHADELIGLSFADLLFDDDLEVVARHFNALRERRPQTFEVRFQRRDGTVGELEIIGLPIVVHDEVVEIYGIAEDITERKRFQRELDDARQAAEAASAAKSAFLATMSHEIRTPLTSVLAAAELLADSGLSDQQRRLVTLMERSGERLLRLVSDILDFSRIEAGRADLVAAPFVLAELVDETVQMTRSTLDAKGLETLVHVDAGLPARLVGDAERIAQVLSNLVDNAAKFTHAGRVEVRAGQDRVDADGAVRVRFDVSDTGIGVPAALQETVFGMFEQVDSSVTREFAGTGLGLAISRQLVTLMGGELTVVSTPGEGSTFSFVVPLAPVRSP